MATPGGRDRPGARRTAPDEILFGRREPHALFKHEQRIVVQLAPAPAKRREAWDVLQRLRPTGGSRTRGTKRPEPAAALAALASARVSPADLVDAEAAWESQPLSSSRTHCSVSGSSCSRDKITDR
jgi:hypothetical protein